MPYQGEYAAGDTLAGLVNSQAVREFEGEIRKLDSSREPVMPSVLDVERRSQRVSYLVAFDGSTVTSRVMNGYPGAEAALLNIAAVVIFLQRMRQLPSDPIPGPAAVRELEECRTLSAVMPGRNVIGQSDVTNTPKRFFRHVIHREISGATLAAGHETLLETLWAITSKRSQAIQCPDDECDAKVVPSHKPTNCNECREVIYPTDSLRAHERFEDHGSSKQAFTVVRTVIEHLATLNVIRWFERHGRLNALESFAFVLDGPLAIFGMAAWLKHYLQEELSRLNQRVVEYGGSGILLMGVEKQGMFMEHLESLDWSRSGGIRSSIAPGTVLVPDLEYIHKHIALRPAGAKPYGSATYYGRKVMYKSKSGQHTVFTLPTVNEEARNPACVDLAAFVRVGDALNLVDEFGTYLYEDGFAPLVRAHRHAAIPLRVGTEILSSIFEDKT